MKCTLSLGSCDDNDIFIFPNIYTPMSVISSEFLQATQTYSKSVDFDIHTEFMQATDEFIQGRSYSIYQRS